MKRKEKMLCTRALLRKSSPNEKEVGKIDKKDKGANLTGNKKKLFGRVVPPDNVQKV